jgi:tRNA pseudouridine55 synthase
MTAIGGLLNVHKPSGATSREVVDRVQRLLPRKTKIGHAGTLDPLACGVLVVCIGSATRLVDYVQRMPKSYTGTFLLGRQSPTEDVEGPVEILDDPPIPTLPRIVAAAARLVGRIEQRPPDFSALKVQGRRAYDLARAGEKVELAAREVDVYRLDVVAYEYPELRLEVRCGGGTYIRSLGRDLARSLGTEAVMSALVRTAIGDFTLAEAVDPAALDRATLADHLLPPLRAVAALPRITLSAADLAEIRHGRTIPYRPGATGVSPVHRPEAPPLRAGLPSSAEMAAVDSHGRLAAILTPRGENRLGPLRNLLSED